MLDPNADNFIDVKHRVMHDDGTIRWISARKHVTFDTGGPNGAPRPITGLVAIMDISDLKQAEDHAQDLLAELNSSLEELTDDCEFIGAPNPAFRRHRHVRDALFGPVVGSRP